MNLNDCKNSMKQRSRYKRPNVAKYTFCVTIFNDRLLRTLLQTLYKKTQRVNKS